MSNLQELERYIDNLGWFSGQAEMKILMERTFEGYWGRASEDWESRVTIEIKEVLNNSNVMVPAIKIVGGRYEGIDKVAGKVLSILKDFKNA